MGFMDRLAHGWNAFKKEDTAPVQAFNYGSSFSGVRPYASRITFSNDKSIISAIYTRIAIDVASEVIQHVKLDPDGKYSETMKSKLNGCLTLAANIDQEARQFKQDMVMTLFDKGVMAIVAVDTDIDPDLSAAYDITSLRVGEILDWRPEHVQVNLYNEKTGRKEPVWVAKKNTAIVENPLFQVMNEPSSTLQRLIKKLSMLDAVDEQLSSGKLDLIIQLPYAIKSDARKVQAENRRKDVEMQLKGSQYGIAYMDSTEKVTQLNRPAENNMLAQVEYLTSMLFSQLGLTEDIFKGTADEKIMINYYNRTIEPILTSITQAMTRSFLSKTARTQGHSIEFYRNPFKFVGLTDISSIADVFARNEIMSSNELRGVIGLKPAKDPKADELRNKNIPAESQPADPPSTTTS